MPRSAQERDTFAICLSMFVDGRKAPVLAIRSQKLLLLFTFPAGAAGLWQVEVDCREQRSL